MTRPVVSLLTDFGVRDVSASICRAVVLGICPDAEVIDLTHEVRKYSIRDGALALWCALPYLPVGFHVAVVDPGVGTARRPLALLTGRGDVLIGPDNGLLVPAAERLGGIVESRELQNPAYRLPVVTSTFHGRDVFAPAAAHLALRRVVRVARAGDRRPARRVAAARRAGRRRRDRDRGRVRGHVRQREAVGARRRRPGRAGRAGRPARSRSRVDGGRTLDVRWARTFGDLEAGDPLLYEDSYGRACVGVNQGSAVASLGLRDGNRLELRPR